MADDDDGNERFRLILSTVRLGLIIIGILIGIALMIPLASVLADKDTRVTVHAARRELTRKVNRLERENRHPRNLGTAQPPLTETSGVEGENQ